MDMTERGTTRQLYPTPSVRLRLDGPDGQVLAEDISTRQRFALGRLSAAALVAFAGGRNPQAVVGLLAELTGYTRKQLETVVTDLRTSELLEEYPAEPTKQAARWRARGWQAAYDFQTATDDLPFVDYSQDGYEVDRQRMADYRSHQLDPLETLTARVREHEPARSRHLTALTGRLTTPLTGPIRGQPTASLSDELLRDLLTICFGLRLAGGKLRRTSPSGGARHPCRAYLLVWPHQELTAGTYAYDGAADLLAELDAGPPAVDPAMVAGSPRAVSFQAVVLIYARFAFNRYRYREPRTLRSVLLDAGHLAATLEETATGLGLVSRTVYDVDEDRLDELLGTPLLEEGFLVAVGLGGTSP